MTSTRSGPRELAEAVGARARELAGLIRRMIVTRAGASSVWQILGHDLREFGGDKETREAEVFAGGIGFASRPAAAGDVEAIVAYPGGPGNPTVIAARQEGVRRKVAADLGADETQIHNSKAIARVKADGTIELRSATGVAQRMILGETYLPAEATFATAISAFAAAVSTFATTCAGPTPAQLGALETAAAALVDAAAAFKAGAYLTTTIKAE